MEKGLWISPFPTPGGWWAGGKFFLTGILLPGGGGGFPNQSFAKEGGEEEGGRDLLGGRGNCGDWLLEKECPPVSTTFSHVRILVQSSACA